MCCVFHLQLHILTIAMPESQFCLCRRPVGQQGLNNLTFRNPRPALPAPSIMAEVFQQQRRYQEQAVPQQWPQHQLQGSMTAGAAAAVPLATQQDAVEACTTSRLLGSQHDNAAQQCAAPPPDWGEQSARTLQPHLLEQQAAAAAHRTADFQTTRPHGSSRSV